MAQEFVKLANDTCFNDFNRPNHVLLIPNSGKKREEYKELLRNIPMSDWSAHFYYLDGDLWWADAHGNSKVITEKLMKLLGTEDFIMLQVTQIPFLLKIAMGGK